MKATIAQLIRPSRGYENVGDLALALQWLIRTATPYWRQTRLGFTGPHQELVNYGSCTNCFDKGWHTSRMNIYDQRGRALVQDYRSQCRNIKECILAAICCDDQTSRKWRAEKSISLDTVIKIPSCHGAAKCEFDDFMAITGTKLPVKTLNSFYDGVNLLCDPELIIDATSVMLTCGVTDRFEIKLHCGSSWNIDFLCRRPHARWRHTRETFPDFIARAKATILSSRLVRS